MFGPQSPTYIPLACGRHGTTAVATYLNHKDFAYVDYIMSVRNVAGGVIVFTPMKDYAAAGAGVPAVLGFNAPWWYGVSIVLNAHIHLGRVADGALYTAADPTVAADQCAVVRIDSSALGDSAANGPYLYVTVLITALVADFVSVVAVGYPRHSYGPNNLPDYTA